MTHVRISIVAAFAALVMVLPQPALAQNGAGELSAAPFVQALVGWPMPP